MIYTFSIGLFTGTFVGFVGCVLWVLWVNAMAETELEEEK